MSYELSEQERDGVIASSPDKQYKHFVTKAADWGEVWTISNGSTYGKITDGDGQDYFPVWPHPDYARPLLEEGEWADAGYEPECVEVHDFLAFCERFEQDGHRVAILLSRENGYVPTEIAPLVQDLRSELDRVE